MDFEFREEANYCQRRRTAASGSLIGIRFCLSRDAGALSVKEKFVSGVQLDENTADTQTHWQTVRRIMCVFLLFALSEENNQ